MARKIFVDIETTGLSVEKDKIVEIAALPMADRGMGVDMEMAFHSLVNPEMKVPEEAVKIHGHDNVKLHGKPKFRDIAGKLTNFLSGCELIAHNADFDVGILDREFKESNMAAASEIIEKVTDTLDIAREVFPGARHSLDALATRAGIDLEVRRPMHGAMIDAEILAEVYVFLTSGQTELALQDGPVTFNFDIPKHEEIRIIPIEHDPEAEKLHEEYLKTMHAETKVKPVAWNGKGPN